MIEETLQEIASAIDNLNLDPNNSFGQSLGDQLYETTWQLQRIADVLEKIEAKMK